MAIHSDEMGAESIRIINAVKLYAMTGEDADKVRSGLSETSQRIESVPKSLKWKIRFIFGTRIPRHREIEEQQLSSSSQNWEMPTRSPR